MLEALCSLRTSDDGISREGDVIVLALAGHPWGTQERKRFIIVKWDDAEIEAELLARQKEFKWPIRSTPYLTRSKAGKIERKATEGVNVKTIATLPYSDAKDPTTTKPVIEEADYAVRVEAGLVSRTLSAIASPFVAAWDWLVS